MLTHFSEVVRTNRLHYSKPLPTALITANLIRRHLHMGEKVFFSASQVPNSPMSRVADDSGSQHKIWARRCFGEGLSGLPTG